MPAGVSWQRMRGAWKNPDYLVYVTGAQISIKDFISPPLVNPNFPRGGCFSRQNFKVLWQLLQKSQRKETATGAAELGVEKASGQQVWDAGADAQQDDRTLKTCGKRSATGVAGSSSGSQEVGGTPRTPSVSFGQETSTVRKCTWPTNR